MPARSKWTWNERELRHELHVGILRYYVNEFGGYWWVERLGVRVGVGQKTQADAFAAAEEHAFLTGLKILMELPGS